MRIAVAVMKPTLFAIALCAFSLPLHAADQVPPVKIDRVLALANEALAARGVSDVYIESIEMTKPTVFSKKESWFVKWSKPLPASKPDIKEIGLSVAMDGKVIHVVK